MKLISVILLSCALACANTAPQCKKPTPVPVQPVQPTPVSPTPVTSTNSNVNQNTNSNTNNNTNSNTNNVSASASANQSQQQSQNQSAVANGGNATSGSVSSISERGAVSVAPPNILSTGPCSGSSVSAGVSGPAGGVSFGRGKIDSGCDTRMDANEMFGRGRDLAGCKLLLQEKKFKKAHVTLEDCMGTPAEPVAPVAPVIQITPPPPSPSITVNVPVTVIEPTPAPVAPKVAPKVTKKAVVRHMQPACQNGLELRCVTKGTK